LFILTLYHHWLIGARFSAFFFAFFKEKLALLLILDFFYSPFSFILQAFSRFLQIPCRVDIKVCFLHRFASEKGLVQNLVQTKPKMVRRKSRGHEFEALKKGL